MKRALLICSSYAPAMPANMHRVRMIARHLPQFGWDFEIVAPSLDFQEKVWLEPNPSLFFEPDTRCHMVAEPRWEGILDLVGCHSVNWKALLPIYAAGKKILKETTFDLIFISTTAFNFFCLGRLWQRHFGVPYVLDFHD